MSTSILERLRSLHEDLERYERIVADLQKVKTKTVCLVTFAHGVSLKTSLAAT